MTLYADMVFLINFIMDCFILWIVSKTNRKKNKPIWLLAGGLIMALLYCLLIFVDMFRYMNALVASVLILSMGVAVAFRPTGVKPFLTLLLTAYGISFAVGGLGMVLFYLTDLPYAVYYVTAEATVLAGGISWKLAILCMLASYVMIKLALRAAAHFALKRQMVCPVRVILGDSDIHFDALVDTGHSLREPITQAPVIVAEFEKVKAFLPEGLQRLFYDKQENDLPTLLQAHDENISFYSRMRMIPFTSLGKTNGMLIGFRPDRVELVARQKELTRDDVVIGIYNSRLTPDGRYQGLVSPEIT